MGYTLTSNHEVGMTRTMTQTTDLLSRAAKLSLLAVPLVLEGCSGAYWGNLVVLGVSFGIFYGTLSLGRSTPTSRGEADASQISQLSQASRAARLSTPPTAGTSNG